MREPSRDAPRTVGEPTAPRWPLTIATPRILSPTAVQPTPGHFRRQVLVVDDNPGFRRGLCGLLSRQGFEVATACDSEDAFQILEEGRRAPDAIVTDLVMPPGRDGVELAWMARSAGFSGAIVLVSGTPREELAKRPDLVAVDRILTKPATLEVIDALKALLVTKPTKRWDMVSQRFGRR